MSGWLPGSGESQRGQATRPDRSQRMDVRKQSSHPCPPASKVTVTDRVCSPPEYVRDYEEKLFFMPNSFYVTEEYSKTHPECLEKKRLSASHKKEILEIAQKQFKQRASKSSGNFDFDVVIANFNNWKKLDMHTLTVYCCFLASSCLLAFIKVWAKIMKDVPSSIFWVMAMLPYEGPSDSLKRAFESQGVDPARLVITGLLPSDTHLLAKQEATDVFLDSLAYNAHSTAVELIWANVPVLTSPECKMTARVMTTAAPAPVPHRQADWQDVQVASSLLLAHRMSHLVARNAADMHNVSVRSESSQCLAPCAEKQPGRRLLKRGKHLKRIRVRRAGTEGHALTAG
eukprot:753471-Hanusia_phi.AAC.2